MVNNPVIVRLQPPHTCSLEQRKSRQIITNGPIYCLKSVQENLSSDRIWVLNDKASKDMLNAFSPSLRDEEFIPFIKALTEDDRESSERCHTSINRPLDCDGYSMQWNRIACKRWQDASYIYLKFGFIENNPKLLIVSAHPSKLNNAKPR